MKKSLWIVTIFGSVMGGLILLSGVLAAPGAPQPSSSPAAAQAECDCSNLEALQVELRNAIRLQQAMRNKIPELRAMDHTKSLTEYKRFSENDARHGLEQPPGYEKLSAADKNALVQYNFDVKGFALSDPTHPPKTKEWNEATLCSLTASAQAALTKVRGLAVCAGISEALQAHEDVHTRHCLQGFVAFFNRHGADRAQEEVEAYGAQIAVLRGAIAKVLEHSNFRIEFESNTRIQLPPNPAMAITEIIDNRGVVPMSRAAFSGDMIKLDGEGKQTMNATIEGNCRFTGGLPHTLTVRGSIETDGLEAQIRLTTEGKGPSLKMECHVPGVGTGYGMSMPVTLKSDNVPVINLPLKNGAEQVWDQSTGEAAKMMAQAGAKLSGQAKIRLIFCEK